MDSRSPAGEGTVALVDRGWRETHPVTSPHAISVFAGFVVLALAFGLFAVRRQSSSALPLVCPVD